MKAYLIKFSLILGVIIILYGVHPNVVSAAYPNRCRDCRTPGSWCVEDGGGYECDDRSECGPVLGYTPDCPSGCLCGYARYIGGSLACNNFCITVLSCTSSSPTPTRTPTPEPVGVVRGRIIVDGEATRATGSPACGTAREFPATISVTNPGNVTAVADKCIAGVPSYEATTTIRSHRISAPDPSNMFVGYTACADGTCHTSPPTQGDRVTLDVPAGGIDVWWHYSSPGSLKVKTVTSADNCPVLNDSTAYFPGALSSVDVTGLSGGSIVGNEKVWDQVLTDPDGVSYSITAGDIPEGFAAGNTCWVRGADSGSGATATLLANSEVTWTIGFIPPQPWVQVKGGDVYAKAQVGSSLPVHSPPHKFNNEGSGGTPGLVIYGEGFDFAADPDSNGSASDVSSKEWIALDDYDTTIDYYLAFYALLGSPTAGNWDADNPEACLGIPCYAPGPGPFTISTPMNVASGQKYVILVNDDLNINAEIHVENGGFLAFIVSGNINIDDNVGTTDATSEEPQVEGIFVTGGGIHTGSGNKKLVAEGMFIAKSFTLDRKLDGAGNAENPAELFLYAPRFLLTMPEEMSESLLLWSEVNP